ncbi:MAG: ferritin family protein [Planctomycetes bacterium]|nr:ferritin family protein [Planctomycetota bacterium]
MDDKLSCTQILELALDKEKQAYEFYRKAGQTVKDSNAKMLFDLFAIEEQKHIARLEFELIKSGKTTPQTEDLLDLNDLDFIVDVTDEMKDIYMDILLGAINKEHESFKLYISLLAIADSPESRNVLEALIEEEARHKLLLEMKYNHASIH